MLLKTKFIILIIRVFGSCVLTKHKIKSLKIKYFNFNNISDIFLNYINKKQYNKFNHLFVIFDVNDFKYIEKIFNYLIKSEIDYSDLIFRIYDNFIIPDNITFEEYIIPYLEKHDDDNYTNTIKIIKIYEKFIYDNNNFFISMYDIKFFFKYLINTNTNLIITYFEKLITSYNISFFIKETLTTKNYIVYDFLLKNMNDIFKTYLIIRIINHDDDYFFYSYFRIFFDNRKLYSYHHIPINKLLLFYDNILYNNKINKLIFLLNNNKINSCLIIKQIFETIEINDANDTLKYFLNHKKIKNNKNFPKKLKPFYNKKIIIN